MRALAIVALVFSSISIIVPVGGIFIAIFCSLLAVITFRNQPTISGVTFGINIISTAFLSPSIMLSDAVSSKQLDVALDDLGPATEVGEVYWTYVGIHILLLLIAASWRLLRGKPD